MVLMDCFERFSLNSRQVLPQQLRLILPWREWILCSTKCVMQLLMSLMP